MPTMQKTVSVAANSVNANVFAGSAFEYARFRQIVNLGVCQSATGLFCTFNVGADVVVEEFEPTIQTRYPNIPDEFWAQDVADPGDRVVLAARNSTAGALTVRAIAMLTNV